MKSESSWISFSCEVAHTPSAALPLSNGWANCPLCPTHETILREVCFVMTICMPCVYRLRLPIFRCPDRCLSIGPLQTCPGGFHVSHDSAVDEAWLFVLKTHHVVFYVRLETSCYIPWFSARESESFWNKPMDEPVGSAGLFLSSSKSRQHSFTSIFQKGSLKFWPNHQKRLRELRYRIIQESHSFPNSNSNFILAQGI